MIARYIAEVWIPITGSIWRRHVLGRYRTAHRAWVRLSMHLGRVERAMGERSYDLHHGTVWDDRRARGLRHAGGGYVLYPGIVLIESVGQRGSTP